MNSKDIAAASRTDSNGTSHDTLALAELCRFRSSPTNFKQIVNISHSHCVCFKCVLTTRGCGSFRQHAGLFYNSIGSEEEGGCDFEDIREKL